MCALTSVQLLTIGLLLSVAVYTSRNHIVKRKFLLLPVGVLGVQNNVIKAFRNILATFMYNFVEYGVEKHQTNIVNWRCRIVDYSVTS